MASAEGDPSVPTAPAVPASRGSRDHRRPCRHVVGVGRQPVEEQELGAGLIRQALEDVGRVGSAQCKSSIASATGCERAPARTQATIAANCRRRNSSGGRLGTRLAGNGMSTIGASRGAYSAGSRPTNFSVPSRSARRCSAGSSAPNRWRPHSANGCKGVFCRSCDDDHSTQVCGVSPRRARNPR